MLQQSGNEEHTVLELYHAPAALETPPVAWSYQMDVFTDPRYWASVEGPGSFSRYDFEWRGFAVLDNAGFRTPEGNFKGEIIGSGGNQIWRFSVDDAGPAVDVPLSQWYTLEMHFDQQTQIAPDYSYTYWSTTYKVWNQNHSQLLLQYQRDSLEITGDNARPNGMVFWQFDDNIPQLLVDNVGVGPRSARPRADNCDNRQRCCSEYRRRSRGAGGVGASFNDVESSGEFSAAFSQPSTAAQLEAALGGAAGEIDFLLPGQAAQLWQLEFSGQFAGLVTLTLHYNDANIFYSESALRVMHYTNGAWEMPPNQLVDTLANTIRFQVSNFSPFLLSAVPEPSSAAIITSA